MTDPEDAGMPPVKRRFSERIGESAVPIQVGSMDARLRSAIWNLVRQVIPSDDSDYVGGEPDSTDVVQLITINLLGLPVEHIDARAPRQWLYGQVQGMDWAQVYDLLEYISYNAGEFSDQQIRSDFFLGIANAVLEKEHSGYRFVGDVLTEATSPTEIETIETAMRDAESHGLGPVHTHIKEALRLLGARPEPNFRNAIKEAISAVESAANLIQGGKKRTLDPVLDLLEKRIKLHRAFKDALSKLYGFTSDDSGIRHALTDEPTVDAADARFFIAACSAFVSWLIAKAGQAGLLDSDGPA